MPTEVLPLTGSLDIDTSLSIVKKGDFVDSLNTTAVSKLTNDSTIRTTEPGNQPFPVGDYVLPGGVSKVIGGISDETKNRIIDFLYNDSGACQIRWWDINTQTIKVILNDASDQTLDGTILDFDINAKITGISIIHRDPTDGDLLYWTTNDGNPPRCINIDKCLLNTGDYNGLSYDDISQIKRPPLIPPQVSYGNDTAHAANNLRSKLFQFAYRYIYDDYAPSTYSPWSKVPYPIGSVDPNIDTVMTNNNVINVSLGLINNLVVKIEIIVRVSVEPNLWSDPVLIDTIQISDPKPPSYGVAFYNDGAYPPVNVTEVAMLFSYLPDLASTMTMVNGNVIVMGEIVEGRNYNDVTLDVAMSAGLEDAFNSSSGQATPIPLTTSDFAVSVSYPDSVTATWTITYLGQTPIQGTAVVTLGYYVVTRQNHGLYSTKKAWETPPYPYVVFNMTEATPTASQNVKYQTSSTDHIITGDTNYNIVSVQGSRTNQSDLFFSQPRYDWWAHYQWAIIYYDKNGKTNTAYTDTDMSLFMPPYHQYQNGVGGDVTQAPYIDASISHLAPAWAVSYQWARSLNLSESMALYWHSPQILTDNKFIYLDISNLLYNYEKVNPSTNLKYDFVPGDRLRMIYYFNNPESSPESYSNKEYVVIAEVTNPTAGTGDYLTGFNVTNPGFGYTTPPTVSITGGGGSGASAHAVIGSGGVISIVLDVQGAGYTSAPDVTLTGGGGSGATAVAISGYFQGTFLKLNIDKDSYPAGDVIFKVYRPQQQVDTENTVFYEFGEQYPVIVVNGVHYHGGMLQNQGQNQPATFKFTEGDMFLTVESIPKSTTEVPVAFWEDVLMAMNYDDYYPSGQTSNGRAVGVFVMAKRLSYPTLYRYSEAYLGDTYVNKLSLFLSGSQDDLNRAYGAIRRFSFRENFLRVYQELKVGRIPVAQNIMQTAQGNDVLTQSEKLFNKVQYYESELGIGDAPCTLISENFADYFLDTNHGKLCRVSQDGVDPLSVLYHANSLFSVLGPKFNASRMAQTTPNPATPTAPIPFCFGVMDTQRNEYFFMSEAIDRWRAGKQVISNPAVTFAFNESNNGFQGWYSFEPEFALCVDNLLCTFRAGLMYTHDGPTPCNFYGVQYDAYLTPVMNENLPNDKSYLSIRESANAVWWCDEIKTNLGQLSAIPSSSFKVLEGNASASFFRDKNSTGGLANGTPLKGKWLTARCRLTPIKDSYISAISLKYNVYP